MHIPLEDNVQSFKMSEFVCQYARAKDENLRQRFKIFIYLAARGLHCRSRIFSCGI